MGITSKRGFKKGYVIPANAENVRTAKQRKVVDPIAYKPPEDRRAYKVIEIITKPFKEHDMWWRLLKIQKADNYRITGMTDEMFLTKEAALKLKIGDIVHR